MSGPICFSQIPSKSARDSTKDSCLYSERLKTLFVALFEQRLEFIRKAEKVFGLVVFWAGFFLISSSQNTEDPTGFVFLGSVKTSGRAREVKPFFLLFFGRGASRGAACRLWVGFFFSLEEEENSLTTA